MNKKFKLLLCISAVVGVMNIAYAEDYGDIETTQTISGNDNRADSIYIGGSKSVTNNGELTVSGDSETYGKARINNNNGATLTIEGDVYNYRQATITNDGTLNVDGTFSNSDTNNSISQFINNSVANIGVDLDNYTTVNNSGNLTITGSLINEEVWENDNGKLKQASFTNTGTLTVVEGDITNGSGAKFDNSGNVTVNGILSNAENYEGDEILETKFTNTGTITVEGGEFTNDASIDGNGTLKLTDGATGSNTAVLSQNHLTVENGSEYSNTGEENIGTLTISGPIYEEVTDPEIEPDILTEASKYTNEGFLNVDTIYNNGELTNTGISTFEDTEAGYGEPTEIKGGIVAQTINNNEGAQITNSGSIKIEDTLTNNGTITNNGLRPDAYEYFEDENQDITSTVQADGGIKVNSLINNGTIEGEGLISITSGSNSGSIEQSIIEVTSDFENNGTLISNDGFNNSGEISGTGSIVLNGMYETDDDGNPLDNNINTGTISQNNVTIEGNFVNDGKLISNGEFQTDENGDKSGGFSNSGELIGSGTLSVQDGVNDGTIEQNEITINNTFTNNSEITSNTTFTNHAEISGEGTLNIVSGTSDGKIAQNYVNITGNFTNSADLTATEELSNSGTITNSALITAIIDNSNTIKGTGDIIIKGGTNSGTINLDEVTTADDIVNNGNIIAYTFTNTYDITDDNGTGTITVNTRGENSGSINQKSITNNGTFVNTGDITAPTIENKGTFTNSGENASLTNANVTNTNKFEVIDSADIKVNNITNTGTITLANASTLTITAQENNLGGTINVAEGTNTLSVTGAEIASNINIEKNEKNTTLNFIQGTINETAKVDLAKDSSLNIAGGNVNLNNDDKWSGSITLNSGSLNIADIKSNGQLTAESGSLKLVENKGKLTIASDSEIKSDVTTTIEKGSELNIKGGNVELNDGDSWQGTINLGTTGVESDQSTLTVGLTDNTGTLHADNGNLINSQNLTVGDGSYIKQEVAIQTSGNIKITDGGYVAINNNDTLNSGAKLTLDGGTLDYGRTGDASALVEGNTGNLNLLSGSTLTISSGSNIQDAVALDIQNGATLNLEENLTLNLDSQDKWNGHINNENGIINAKGVTEASGSLKQDDGQLNLSEASKINLNSNSSITGGDIKIEDNSSLTIADALLTGGDMTIDKNSAFIVKSAQDKEFTLDSLKASGTVNPDGSAQAPLIDVMNSQLNVANITSLNIENQGNFNVDILGRSTLRNESDKFVIGSFAGDTIRIDDWKLYGDVFGYDAPIDRHVKLGSIFVDKDGNPLEATIETTDKANFSPIGWYQLNKGAGAGNYTLDLVKFNPQVFRGQVATVSQWMNQLAIDDMLFTHSMVLPSFKEEDGGKMANHYAAANPLFAPYQYSRKEGGIWYKTYGTFEHLQMNNGLKHVGNNAYGALIGADFGLKDLKHGWKFMPTAYIGYNGAHQYWSDVSQYQNGGQAGFLGTWYKNNFILGAMAYGGVYGNTMDVYGHTDETFNYFAGTAAKASYNIRVHRDFVIQPNLMAAYNYFGQQNWHSNFGQMGMMSGMLHGVNIAPGINFIWERETFSAYLTLQYMYNINGASGGRAGNVDLPQLEMERGYIQYGIGFTKKFTDRASGYFQAVLRNVGRTGVGLQAGFLFRLGK